MSGDVAPRARPRERILETARDLFHKNGIRAVGVDAIAEAAGTNKMTLYRHFTSKDDLIAECLRSVACEGAAIWKDIEERYPGDRIAQLHAWVRVAADCVVNDARGCALANAAVELTEAGHPARRVVEDFKTAQRDHLAGLCKAAGVVRAELLADTLSLLIEGARVSRQSVGPDGPSAHFVQTAEAIIASFLAERAG
jgi:AcrR family transcriptional regulator